MQALGAGSFLNRMDSLDSSRPPFGPAQLIGLIVALLAVVILIIALKGENHSRYGEVDGPTSSSSIAAP